MSYTPSDRDPQRQPYPGSAHDPWLEEFVSISVRRYRDGTVRATSAVWKKEQNRMVFRQLSDPPRPHPAQRWTANALLQAARDFAVDEEVAYRLF